MRRIASAREVLGELAAIRRAAADFRTNLFAAPEHLEAWSASGLLFGVQGVGATLLLRREASAWRLYFAATDLAALGAVLHGDLAHGPDPLVADLVGSQAATTSVVEVFAAAGFRRHRRLERMAAPAGGSGAADRAATGGTRVRRAGLRDEIAVRALLEASFDRLAEPIPDQTEMIRAIEEQRVLVAGREGAVRGALVFETQGRRSLLQFWAVVPEARAEGIGSALMRTYLSSHREVRRFLLWVDSANRRAIAAYRHYRFEADGLIDDVVVGERAGWTA